MPIQNTASEIDALEEKIFKKIRDYIPGKKLQKFKEAYEFSKNAHGTQIRRSGDPYLIHPLRTAEILADLRADEDTLVAGLLHDVVEDTTTPLPEIENLFGGTVSYLVDGVTKLSKMRYRERMEQRQIESLKKLFIHSARDLRVILIKLADRLDNMRTLSFIANDKKRKRIAKETIEIYVPIANLLGIGELHAELEDLCFSHLHPDEYKQLKQTIEENVEQRGFILDEMMQITQKELKINKIDAEISGRHKSLYSLYKKLQTKQTILNIDDITAIRVALPLRQDCYYVLGIIHRLFKPKIGRFKDYIAVPKPNGYQSLHTTVFGLDGSIVEFQIRTRYMHLEAEYGIAAHYFYKYSGNKEISALIQQRSNWIQRILEMQKDQNGSSSDFLENLKLDVFQDRIFVFSPKGEVFDLPVGASCIDFAYAVHSDIGSHASKAEINGTRFPVTATLGNGDTVNIITDKNYWPDLEWLNCAKTSLALHKIREFLKHASLGKKLESGRKHLEKEFSHIGRKMESELTSKRIKLIAEKLQRENLDEILTTIAEGDLHPKIILEIIYGQKEPGAETTSQTNRHLRKIDLKITGNNSSNQFAEITRTMNGLRVPVEKFAVDKPWHSNHHRCLLTVLIKDYSELSQVFESLEQLAFITSIKRRAGNKFLIILLILAAISVLVISWLTGYLKLLNTLL